MKAKNEEDRGFFLVGNRWNYSRYFNGKRYRLSTGCEELDEAKEWIKYYKPELLHKHLKLPEAEVFLPTDCKFVFTRQWFAETLYRLNYRNKLNGATSISNAFLNGLITRSKGRCELTGIKFNNEKIGKTKRLPFIPSVDRIDSSLPYSRENSRLVCLAANIAMNGWGEKLFDFISEARVEHKRQKKLQK